jgi:hypothetical protein
MPPHAYLEFSKRRAVSLPSGKEQRDSAQSTRGSNPTTPMARPAASRRAKRNPRSYGPRPVGPLKASPRNGASQTVRPSSASLLSSSRKEIQICSSRSALALLGPSPSERVRHHLLPRSSSSCKFPKPFQFLLRPWL